MFWKPHIFLWTLIFLTKFQISTAVDKDPIRKSPSQLSDQEIETPSGLYNVLDGNGREVTRHNENVPQDLPTISMDGNNIPEAYFADLTETNQFKDASMRDKSAVRENEDIANDKKSAMDLSGEVISQEDIYEENCKVEIDIRSINYFRSRLQINDPNFIRFKIVFGNISVGFTNETFYAFNWVWTYNSSNGIYPYLHWNVDYGTLSFKLLDVKTLDSDPYIYFNVSDCSLELGTRNTTMLLAEQFKVLVSELSSSNDTITKYQESYWCYMAEAPGFRETFGYLMGLYFVYPISVINYNCCYTFYNYTKTMYEFQCMDKQMDKWVQCTIGPYILGVILFLYFPFILLKAAAWSISNRETSNHSDVDEPNEGTPLITDKRTLHEHGDDDWLYLDGTFPKCFMGLLASFVPDRFPTALSRLKRFLFVLLGPLVIYLQLWLYSSQNEKMREITHAIIAKEVPVGFLSLLDTNATQRDHAFVPAFGGPLVMLISYYILGMVFLVIPRSVQEIVENGIPRLASDISPLNFSARQIRELSLVYVSESSGYRNAKNLLLCSFYMLFTGTFWKKVFEIQALRVRRVPCYKLGVFKGILILLLPLYIVLCFVELLLCIVYFTIPLCSVVVIIVRGAVKTMAITIHSRVHSSKRGIFSVLLKNRLVIAVLSLIVAVLFIFYVYSFSLVFIQSFFFLSQILVYCYVAVLVYPSVAFGYIFFGVVLLYYIFRLIRGFGVKYLDLLNDIVEISLAMEERDNYSAVTGSILVIRNVKISRFQSIKINDATIPVAQNVLQSAEKSQSKEAPRLAFQNNVYGIKKDLFDYVVSKHLPVHQQVLKVGFNLSLICLCLLITASLTAGFVTGPTTEMSEVMHVVFIITVGALPRVLEVALHDSSEHILRDIKLRRLEDTINQYWLRISNQEKASTSGLNHVQVRQELAELP